MSRKPVEKKTISQDWLTTYSDMVTLLLTFFVLLYSYSLVDVKKFNALASSLSIALGGGKPAIFEYNTGDAPIVGTDEPVEDNNIPQTEGDIYERITEFVNQNALEDLVTIKEGSRGVVIEFRDKILFDPGKADIKDEGLPVLMKLAELIRNIPNQVVIEGHTDNVPINTLQFPSNWELSSERALNVMWYLTKNRGLNYERFSTAAYGEHSPIASNDTSDGRAQNRRVNVLIVTAKEDPAKKR